jgi:hypothetical protein
MGSKVCDGGTLVQILRFWTLPMVLFLSKRHSCLSFKTQRFGDWILSPSSSKTYSVGSNKQDGVLDKDKTMDNVQKSNICSVLSNTLTFLLNEVQDKVDIAVK